MDKNEDTNDLLYQQKKRLYQCITLTGRYNELGFEILENL